MDIGVVFNGFPSRVVHYGILNFFLPFNFERIFNEI